MDFVRYFDFDFWYLIFMPFEKKSLKVSYLKGLRIYKEPFQEQYFT